MSDGSAVCVCLADTSLPIELTGRSNLDPTSAQALYGNSAALSSGFALPQHRGGQNIPANSECDAKESSARVLDEADFGTTTDGAAHLRYLTLSRVSSTLLQS